MCVELIKFFGVFKPPPAAGSALTMFELCGPISAWKKLFSMKKMIHNVGVVDVFPK
jgi:hypothetical protein